jgi:hypothetical protein
VKDKVGTFRLLDQILGGLICGREEEKNEKANRQDLEIATFVFSNDDVLLSFQDQTPPGIPEKRDFVKCKTRYMVSTKKNNRLP